MLRNAGYGIVKKFFYIINAIFKKINPRYQLSLDSSFYDLSGKNYIYCFKVFGDHSFVKLRLDQIKDNKTILYNINPYDLIKIVSQETIHMQNKNMLKISELLRDNKYKITDGLNTHIFSGEDICDNISLIERLNHHDLYKITYNTGFVRGRNLTHSLYKINLAEYASKNIIPLNIVNKTL